MDLRFRHDLRPDLLELDLKGILLNANGRVSRTVFVLLSLAIGSVSLVVWYAIAVAWGLVAHVVGTAGYAVAFPLMGLLMLVNAYPCGCVIAKRVHDFDRSGRHAFWITPLFVCGLLLWAFEVDGGWADAARWSAGLALALLVLMPGSDDVNDHGTIDYWG